MTNPTRSYGDNDLVYVDPDARAVVGIVQWSQAGNAKKLERPGEDEEDDEESAKAEKSERGRRRRFVQRKRYYPWGTYRSMKSVFRLEGKEMEIEHYKSLDEAIALSQQEPFWD